MLVYSGDLDSCVPYMLTLRSVQALNFSRVGEYRLWTIRGGKFEQEGGYVQEYAGVTFVTVKGAGQMVPKDWPCEGQQLFNRFLDGQPP